MIRAALVDGEGVVWNVIVWDEHAVAIGETRLVVLDAEQPCAPGWVMLSDGSFAAPAGE